VDNGGTFAVQVDGAALTSLQLADDVVATLGTTTYTEAATKGTLIGAVRRDADTTLVDTTNEIAPLQVNAAGQLKVSNITALPAGTNNIGDVDILSIAAGTNYIGKTRITDGTNDLAVDTTWADAESNTQNHLDMGAFTMMYNGSTWDRVRGDTTNGLDVDVTRITGGGIAHDGIDSGNPVKVGAKASATLSDDTMVANADRIDLTGDLDGALYVRNVPLGDLIFEAVSDTGGTSTAFSNFGATASTRSYITSITAFRTDTATTLAYIDFRDGTAGSVIYRVPLPPNGGVTINNGGNPLFYTTANTALAYDVSSALTTIYISVTGFKSKARA
jgi:hypothetical protein